MSSTLQRCSAARLIVAALLTAVSWSCGAQERRADSTIPLSQYAHTAWRIQDAVFDGVPRTITQTADGYVWIGTSAGLVRFDGIRFVPWNDWHSQSVLSKEVVSLLGSSDGSLWVGTTSGMFRFTNGITSHLGFGHINQILETDTGQVWWARSRNGPGKGPLCRSDGRNFKCYGEREGLPCLQGQALAEDGEKAVWVGTDSGLCRWQTGSPLIGLSERKRTTQIETTLSAMGTLPSGDILISQSEVGSGPRLQRFHSGKWEAFHIGGVNDANLDATSFFVDRDEKLWIGTRHGLLHPKGTSVDRFDVSDGLSGSLITNIYQDHEGSIWIATSGGIDRFHPLKVSSVSSREGAATDTTNSVLALRDGSLLAGGHGGLTLVHDNKVSIVTGSSTLSDRRITSLLQDRTGTIWVGVDNELTTFSDGKLNRVPNVDGSPLGIVSDIVQDTEGTVWAITQGKSERIFCIHENRKVEQVNFPNNAIYSGMTADPKRGVWVFQRNVGLVHYIDGQIVDSIPRSSEDKTPNPERLHIDQDGTVWVDSIDGLFRWNHGYWSTLNSRNGLPCNYVFNSIRDQSKGMWLYMECGLIHIPPQQMAHWEMEPRARISLDIFGSIDGAHPAYSPFSPTAAESSDGRLWFANGATLQVVDPNHLEINHLPPPVHIEGVVADRVSYPIRPELRLRPNMHDLQIDYAGLSFIAPQNVRFRYRLSGVDNDWQDVGTRRQAFYMNLRPGSYVFQVIACNNDGVWNMQGDSLRLTIPPRYYQTKWFFALMIVIGLTLVMTIFIVRLQIMAEFLQAQLRERLAERDRIARELHDTLLQGLHGVMLRLQAGVGMIRPDEPSRGILEDALDRADQVIIEGRRSIQDLRSERDASLGIADQFETLLNDLRLGNGTRCEVIVTGTPKALSPVARSELFAVGREAITNAFQHAKAASIIIELNFGKRHLQFSCRDDGVGIPPDVQTKQNSPGHWGLVGMRERALKLQSAFDLRRMEPHGTSVEFKVPARIAYGRLRWRGLWAMFGQDVL